MDARLADHVMDEGHIIDAVAQRRNRLADHLARLAVRAELERRLHPRPQPVLKRLDMQSQKSKRIPESIRARLAQAEAGA
jgi:hypothetical protein